MGDKQSSNTRPAPDEEEDSLLARLAGKTVKEARRVICPRPGSVDCVLEFTDGTTVSFCGEYDEDTVVKEGDHEVDD